MTVNNILTWEYKQMSRADIKAYIKENGELKVLSTYAKESFDDIQFTAHAVGCMVFRGWDTDLENAHKFSEYFHFIPK